MRSTRHATAGIAALLLLLAGGLHAQDGVGTAGAQVLQLPAGSRAPALAGAYTAGSGDADVLFYNPAGSAVLDGAVSVAYQSYFEDIMAGSGATAWRLGRFVVGAGILFLDAGDINEVVPDPAFGGQRGMPTGETVSASETAARVTGAMGLLDNRLRVGAGAGFVSSDLAGVTRSALFVDLGAQYALDRATVGVALRNLGGAMTSDVNGDASLPAEARFGITTAPVTVAGIGAAISADGIYRIQERTTGLVAGLEAGLMPTPELPLMAVARIGFGIEDADEFLAPLRFGAGVMISGFSVDYTYQSYDLLGTVHRIGIRWSR